MSSMLAKKAAVISAIERLAELGDCQSITITLQDTSGAYSVGGATLSSDGTAMILRLSIAPLTICVDLPLTTSSER